MYKKVKEITSASKTEGKMAPQPMRWRWGAADGAILGLDGEGGDRKVILFEENLVADHEGLVVSVEDVCNPHIIQPRLVQPELQKKRRDDQTQQS